MARKLRAAYAVLLAGMIVVGWVLQEVAGEMGHIDLWGRGMDVWTAGLSLAVVLWLGTQVASWLKRPEDRP